MARVTGPPARWKVQMHEADTRRTWRKLHLAIDEATNDIHAVELTTNAVSDAEMVKSLLDDIKPTIAKVGGDGAYDQVKVYDELEARHIQPLISPRVNAIIWTDETGNNLFHPRNETIIQIKAIGLSLWKRQCGYHHGPPFISLKFIEIVGKSTILKSLQN